MVVGPTRAVGSPVRSVRARILAVDDEPSIWGLVERACRREDWAFDFHATGEDGLAAFAAEPDRYDVALLDLYLPGIDGIVVLERLRAIDPGLPVLMLSGEPASESVVRAMRAGAYDYLTKPFERVELIHRIRRAVELRGSVRRLTVLEPEEHLARVMGPSREVARLGRLLSQVAPSDLTVLVEGESGTGKELVARRVHALSDRAVGPFVAIDCGAIPANLMESEFFGHEQGSFTGATAPRAGRLRAADGGTLFLDEIGNLPLATQVKLLRALQEREATPVGAEHPVAFDARVVAATNRPLGELVAEGLFRLDVFHRLAEFPIRIAPLRERPDDLVFLAHRFLREACQAMDRSVSGFSEAAIEQLLGHRWPGNARELRSVVRRAVLLADGSIEELPLGPTAGRSPDAPGPEGDGLLVRVEARLSEGQLADGCPLKPLVRRLVTGIEEQVLRAVLERTGGNKSRTARILELDYKTVLTKVKDLDLES